MQTFWVHTYGCQLNAHESDRMALSLEAAGFTRADKWENADLIVFNTCCIRNTAEQKIVSHIGNALRHKKAHPVTIAVVGCLAKRKKFPGVDYTGDWEGFLRELGIGVMRSGVGNSVIIMQGCQNFCSYCIVPYVRGREISRPSDEIEKEFRELCGGGKTVWLLGQNVNSYKCPKTGIGFVGLLEKLCKSNGDYRINFLSSHPKDFSHELVDFIAKNERIERNIHLPMQSGCNKTLAAMNRKYTIEQYEEKIKYLREKVRGVCVTTDIICGFPGESEGDFLQTVQAVKRIKFNAAFIFPYSRRSGTKADRMDGQIDMAVKKKRATELIILQREISKNYK